MRAPGIVQRHPELWWLVSVAAIVAVGVTVGTSVSGVFRTGSSLPATNPDALVANVLDRTGGGYSGTFTSQVDLDLPTPLRSALTGALPAAGVLLNGTSHQVQYWYGAPDKQRLAVRLRGSEQDLFRNGSTLTTWNTATSDARTSSVSADPVGPLAMTAATPLALTPPQLAQAVLDATRDDSDTTLRSGDTIAGRATYELVLRPHPSASRIGEVHIQVDGREFVPLGVKIFARGASTPSVSVTFSSIRFVAPAERNFTFTPPVAGDRAQPYPNEGPLTATLRQTLATGRTSGTGWTSVAAFRPSPANAAEISRYLGSAATAVKGKWGHGKQLCTPLLCLLVTDKGAMVAGAVSPATLSAAID